MTRRRRTRSALALVILFIVTGCAVAPTAGSQRAEPVSFRSESATPDGSPTANAKPTTATTPSEEGPLCTGWAVGIAAGAKGGSASALDAALSGGGGGANHNRRVEVSHTDNSAVFVSGGARIEVAKLDDGSWIAAQGQNCAQSSDEPAVVAVIDEAALECAPRGIGFVVKTRVRWSPREEVSAWLYDENQAIGSQLLTSEDTSIGGVTLIPVQMNRTRSGKVIAERAITPAPKGSYCLEHPDEPTDPAPGDLTPPPPGR